MPEVKPETSPEWISAAHASRILGCTIPVVRKLSEARKLTRKGLPGCPDRYLRSDVEALGEASIVPALEDAHQA